MGLSAKDQGEEHKWRGGSSYKLFHINLKTHDNISGVERTFVILPP